MIFLFSKLTFLRKITGLDFDGIFFSTRMDLKVEISLINKSIPFLNDLLFLIFCGHEEEITNYLENHPEEIENLIDIAEEILIDKRNEIQKNIIDQSKLFLENQKFYIGNPNGTKIIYEFFDYNCGYCKRVFSDLMELVSEDKNIKIVFIELPVLGQSSLLASKAAYEAFNEGKYFEMHQKLINHRGKITIDNIKTYASEINIEPNLLIEKMNKLDVGFIEENYILADKLDINGTPTFIINKNVIPGAIDKASILRLLSSN